MYSLNMYSPKFIQKFKVAYRKDGVKKDQYITLNINYFLLLFAAHSFGYKLQDLIF